MDPVSGQRTRLTAHQGGILGFGETTTPISAASIVTAGPDLMTVTTAATTSQQESWPMSGVPR